MFLKCTVVVLASILQSFGLTLQRLSHTHNDLTNSSSSVNLWRCGIAIFVLSNIFGSTVQLTVLPLALVCTLQSIGILANSVFAHFLLNEPLTRKNIYGTLLVTIGAVLVAGFGGIKQEPKIDFAHLLKLILNFNFLVYFIFTLLVCVVLLFYNKKSGILWGVVAGVSSAHSLLMAKLSVEQLTFDFNHLYKLLLDGRYWIMVSMFLFFALFQMWCVNLALKKVSSAVLYPLVFCVYNVITLLNSSMLYGDLFMNVGCVGLGTVVLLWGVVLLSKRFDEEEVRVQLGEYEGYTSFDALT